MKGGSSRAALAVRLGADHERVPSQGTDEVGVAEVRIYISPDFVFSSHST
jgi:hypothetical protein